MVDEQTGVIEITYDPHPLSRYYEHDALEKYGLQIVENPHREMQTSSFSEVHEWPLNQTIDDTRA